MTRDKVTCYFPMRLNKTLPHLFSPCAITGKYVVFFYLRYTKLCVVIFSDVQPACEFLPCISSSCFFLIEIYHEKYYLPSLQNILICPHMFVCQTRTKKARERERKTTVKKERMKNLGIFTNNSPFSTHHFSILSRISIESRAHYT